MRQEQSGPGGLAPAAAQDQTTAVEHTHFDPPSATSNGGTDAGERAKHRALAATTTRYAGRVLQAQRTMVRLLLDRSDDATVTIDEVRAALGDLPDRRPNWLGAVPAGLAEAGLIERAGYVPSARPTAHARPVSAWRLRDREAAEAWLPESGGNA